MNIYIITINKEKDYDYFDSHVVAANNKEEVLELVIRIAADEGKDAYVKENITKIGIYTKENTIPHIILSSFNAG